MTWTVDDIQKWVTLAGALGGVLGGAIAGSLNLWWKYREKADKIKVGVGLIDPQVQGGYFLHVVSRCDHQMRLSDYGYIDERGRLMSLPNLLSNEPDGTEPLMIGSTFLEKRNDSFETGLDLRDRQIGVYAVKLPPAEPGAY